jgi:gliding motility-associated-like protein
MGVDFPSANGPAFYVAIDDVNGDTHPDVAIASGFSGTASIFINDGLGGFATETSYPSAAGPHYVVLKDLNGDGRPEMIVANSTANSISVLLNNGAGLFSVPVIYPTENYPTTISVADMDNDGKIDLVVGNPGSGSITVFPGDGAGGFGAYQSFSVGGQPYSVATGDFDEDGNLDIVTVDLSSNKVTLLRTLSNSTCIPSIVTFAPTSGPIGTTVNIIGANFSATPANNIVYFGATEATVTAATPTQLTVTVPMGATYEPISVTIGTLSAYSSRPFITTFPSAGVFTSCSFEPKVDFATGSTPLGISASDFDGDGKVDVAVGNRVSRTIGLYLNTSSVGQISAATFAAPITLATPPLGDPYKIRSADIDGDGKIDIVSTVAALGIISVYRNTSTVGALSFDGFVNFPAGADPVHLEIMDLDGDGKPEIVIANRFSNTISVYKNTSNTGGLNASSFAPKVDFTVGIEPYLVTIGDLNSDGKPDIVASSSLSNTISIFQNTTATGVINSSSLAAPVVLGTGAFPVGLTLSDMDGDGLTDVVVVNSTPKIVSVLRSIASGTLTSASFQPSVDFSVGNDPADVIASDFDGDGKVDLVAGNTSAATISLLRNTATPGVIDATSFANKIDLATGTLPAQIRIADIDGDGKPEIVVSNMSSSTFSVLRNVADTPAPTITSFIPGAGPVGSSVTIAGTNFSSTPADNTVTFNGIAATVTASTTTTISVVVPLGAASGPVTVTVNCQAVNSPFTVCSLSAPTTTDGDHCGPGTVNLLASGAAGAQEYRWYDVPAAGTPQGTLAAYATPSITVTGSYYASIFDVTTGCESPRAPVVANIRTVPPAPGVTGDNSCVPATLTLGATGGVNGDYRWYTLATGGTTIPGEVFDTYATPVLTATTTYFVALANAFCESNPRVAVTASINTVAAPAIVTTTCTATSATLDGPAGFTGYLWSTGATSQQLIVTSAGSYTLIVTSSAGCTSPPSAPASFAPTFCNQPPTASSGNASTTVMVPVIVGIISLINDPDNNLNIATLIVVGSTTSGAPATINANNELVIDYSNTPFAGTDKVTLEICDQAGACVKFEVSIEVAGEITIYNAISPNGDGKNDYLSIEYIDALPDTKENKLTLFDRWGSVVFEASDYDNTTSVFRGLGKNGEELPSGTYYYTIEFASGAPKRTGFISLRK